MVSVACMLLFGKNPQSFFPRARTRFIRYQGMDEKVGTEMNVIKDVIFEGIILHQIEKTVEYLETQVAEHTFLGQAGKFVTRRDYTKFVIQEMIVNACCHRAYNIKGTEIQIKMFEIGLCLKVQVSCLVWCDHPTFAIPIFPETQRLLHF